MRQKHHKDGFGHNHAGGRFIGKLGVELKAKFCEKLDGLLEMFDG
jgi:hypothetical protein